MVAIFDGGGLWPRSESDKSAPGSPVDQWTLSTAEPPRDSAAVEPPVPPLNLAEARKLQEQVVTAYRRTLGDRHPDTRTAMDHLALIRATALGQKVRGIFRRN